MRARDNPFRSERIEALAFRPMGFEVGPTVDRALELGASAIVGPEGVGKTTLLESLRHPLEQRGFRVHLLRLHPGDACSFRNRGEGREAYLVDGLESAGGRALSALRGTVNRDGVLVATAHRPGLLPTLVELRTSPELLRELVFDLLGEEGSLRLQPDLPRLFERHRGDMRACFRELYDRLAQNDGGGPKAAPRTPPTILGRQ